MHGRGKVRQPHRAVYLIVDAKVDAYKTLWKKRVVLGWYPGKMPSDAHLASFILENISGRTGELWSVALMETGGHSLRSLSDIAGLPTSTVRAILERWADLHFIDRCAIGEGKRAKISIDWNVIRTGFSVPAPIEAWPAPAETPSASTSEWVSKEANPAQRYC